MNLNRLPRRWQQHRQGTDGNNPPVVENDVAHGKRSNDPNPKLTRFLRRVDELFPELRVNAETAVEFLHRMEERSSVPAQERKVAQFPKALEDAP